MGDDSSFLSVYFSDRIPDLTSELAMKVDERLPSLVTTILSIVDIQSAYSATLTEDIVLNSHFSDVFYKRYDQGKGDLDLKTWAEHWFLSKFAPTEFIFAFADFYGISRGARLNTIEARFKLLMDPLFPEASSLEFSDRLVEYGFNPEDIEMIYTTFPKPPSTVRRDFLCLILSAIILQCLRVRKNNSVNSDETPLIVPDVGGLDTKELIRALQQMGLEVMTPKSKKGVGRVTRSGKQVMVESSSSSEDESASEGEDEVEETGKAVKSKLKRTKMHGNTTGIIDLNLLKQLYSAPSPPLVHGSNKVVGSMVHKGTRVNKLDWLYTGEILPDELVSLSNTWLEERDVDESVIQSMLGSSDGMILLDVRGVPHSVRYKKAKETTGVPTGVIWNPDNNSALARMSKVSSAQYIWPTTSPMLLQFISEQMLSCHDQSAINFKQDTDKAKHTCLADFNKLILGLLSRLNLIFQGGQQERLHITSMALVSVFFINRWMTAMLSQDLSLLNNSFDNIWMSKYEGRARVETLRIIPKVSLKISLFILGYFCDKCHTRGCSLTLCCVKCNVDASSKGNSTYSKPAAKKGKASGNFLEREAYKVFLAWKKADPSRKSTTVESYISTQGITSGIVARSEPTTTTGSVDMHDVYERNAVDQRLVRLHRCEYDV